MGCGIPLFVARPVDPEGSAKVVGGEVEFFRGVLRERGEDAVVADLGCVRRDGLKERGMKGVPRL